MAPEDGPVPVGSTACLVEAAGSINNNTIPVIPPQVFFYPVRETKPVYRGSFLPRPRHRLLHSSSLNRPAPRCTQGSSPGAAEKNMHTQQNASHEGWGGSITQQHPDHVSALHAWIDCDGQVQMDKPTELVVSPHARCRVNASFSELNRRHPSSYVTAAAAAAAAAPDGI